MSGHYLRPSLETPAIYLYRPAVDFRKQAFGLAAIVEQDLGHNPFEGGLYVFTNRQRNKIKCLLWEDNGFVLWYKSLSQETFRWPAQGEDIVSLSDVNYLGRFGDNYPGRLSITGR